MSLARQFKDIDELAYQGYLFEATRITLRIRAVQQEIEEQDLD
jgi:hypothetical protein